MEMTIEIFLCYAHEDEEYQQQLEKQLSLSQRNGRINLWHNGKIKPGEAQQQVTFAHLDTAQIVLLLVSPNFIASNYCYCVMKRARELYEQKKTPVIPIILSPVGWQDGPLEGLQALPNNGKPIRGGGRNLDVTFFEVAEGIRHVIEEIKTQLPVTPLSSQEPEKRGKNLRHSSVQEQKPLSGKFSAEPKAHQETGAIPLEDLSQANASRCLQVTRDEKNQFDKNIQKHECRNRRKRRLLVSLFVLLILIFPLFSFLPRPLCFATFCHFSQQPTQQPVPQNEGEVQDQNLAVQFIGTQQNTFTLPGDPLRLSPNQLSKQGVPALCIDQHQQQSVFRITIVIHNLRKDQYVLLIEQVQLIVEQITFIPRPLDVFVQSPPVMSNYNLYRALYMGQDPNTRILTKYDNPPSDYVFLTLHETDKISIQVASSVEVFLSFRIAITYRVANEGQTHTLTLPHIFQMIFTHTSNWHPYQVRDGRFTQLDTP
jgi:hypothetical protein